MPGTCADCGTNCEIARYLRDKGCNVSLLTCFAWTQPNGETDRLKQEAPEDKCMKGKWKVTCNPIDGQRFYRVYRLRDIYEVDHSGNREYDGEYTLDKQEAVDRANALNAQAEQPAT